MPQPPKLPYTLDEEKKHEFARLYLLDYMIEEEPKIPIMLDEHNEDLEPLFEELMARELIEIDKSQCYRVSKKGVERHRRFLRRYREMMAINDIFCAVDLATGEMAINDIFCAVDLATGEFAFSYYDDYPDRRSWENFLSQPRWDDLRIAVAEYLGEDPIELVFMSFINEKRFGRDADGKWQGGTQTASGSSTCCSAPSGTRSWRSAIRPSTGPISATRTTKVSCRPKT